MDNNNLYNNGENTESKNEALNTPAASSENTAPVSAAQNVQPNAEQYANQNTANAVPQNNTQYTAPQNQAPQYGAQNNGQYNAQQHSGPDFSRYSDTTSNFSSIPNGGQPGPNTVYIDNKHGTGRKKEKAPKGRLGVGAVAALVAVCVVISGGAAFAGT